MLSIKLKPGQRITIGDEIVVDVVLDAGRKLALHIAAPATHAIVRSEHGTARTRPNDPNHKI